MERQAIMSSDYPRVTIISASPLRNDQTNGILMSSLFRGWPYSHLHQIYFRYFINHRPEGDVCHHFSVVDLKGQIRPVQPQGCLATDGTQAGGTDRIQKCFRVLTRSQSFVNWARCAHELWQVNSGIADRLRALVRKTRPDVVYSLVGNYTIARLVTDVCRDLSLPLVMHVSDDFSSSAYQQPPLTLLRRGSVKAFGDMVSYATGRAACSPRMAEEYTQRYGKPWCWFTSLVDATAYDPAPLVAGDRLHCVFAGNLGLGRWKSLLTVSAALEELQRRYRLDAQLHVYSSPDQIAAFQRHVQFPSIVKVKGWVSPEKLPEIFRMADVLVHVESSQPSIVEYVRYSLSAKISQYLMSGRCILAVGPTSVGSISLVDELTAGLAIEEHELVGADSRLNQLCDPDWRAIAGRKGREWALSWLERTTGHTRFRDALNRASVQAFCGRSDSATLNRVGEYHVNHLRSPAA